MEQSNRKTKGLKNTTLFCDNCGDITVAVRPITIILWDKTEIRVADGF